MEVMHCMFAVYYTRNQDQETNFYVCYYFLDADFVT